MVAQRNLETHGQSWDEELSPEDLIVFRDWASELSHMIAMSIERSFFLKNEEVVELYVFPDAFSETMCIVAYFQDQPNGELSYVVRTCRVAPYHD